MKHSFYRLSSDIIKEAKILWSILDASNDKTEVSELSKNNFQIPTCTVKSIYKQKYGYKGT